MNMEAIFAVMSTTEAVVKIRPEKKKSGLYGIPYRPEGINWTRNKALTKINLNCFYLFFVFVFFCVKVFTCEVPVDGRKKKKRKASVCCNGRKLFFMK